MTLYDKICSIYPSLIIQDFLSNGVICLEYDINGNGHIAKWNHPTLPRPTDEQLGATE
jgi:hypothetical protein